MSYTVETFKIGFNKAQAQYAYDFYAKQRHQSPALPKARKLIAEMPEDGPIPDALIKIFYKFADQKGTSNIDKSIIRLTPDNLYVDGPKYAFIKDGHLIYYESSYCTWSVVPIVDGIPSIDIKFTGLFDKLGRETNQDGVIIPSFGYEDIDNPNYFVGGHKCDVYWNGRKFQTNTEEDFIFNGKWMATHEFVRDSPDSEPYSRYTITEPPILYGPERLIKYEVIPVVVVNNYHVCLLWSRASVLKQYREYKGAYLDKCYSSVTCTLKNDDIYINDVLAEKLKHTYSPLITSFEIVNENMFIFKGRHYKYPIKDLIKTSVNDIYISKRLVNERTGECIKGLFECPNFIIANDDMIYEISPDSGSHTKAAIKTVEDFESD